MIRLPVCHSPYETWRLYLLPGGASTSQAVGREGLARPLDRSTALIGSNQLKQKLGYTTIFLKAAPFTYESGPGSRNSVGLKARVRAQPPNH